MLSRKDSTQHGHLRVTPIASRVERGQTTDLNQGRYMGLNSRYEIRVKGILDGGGGPPGPRTSRSPATGKKPLISGPLADQAALHGLLAKVRDLGMFLISVCHLDPD